MKTIEEIAEELKFDIETVRTWCKSKQLKAFKIGREWRIKEEDYRKFLADREF
jgi:excisionase family DNA binding protein